MILADPLLAETGFAATLSSVFFYCAVVGGAALLLQLVLMLTGIDDADLGDAGGLEADVDFDADGTTDSSGYWFFEMVSLRTLAAASTLFGAVGRIALDSGQSVGVSLTLAGVAGYAAMYTVYWIFKQIMKLETSGSFDIRNAVGRVGQVYIPIDPGAAGKIQVKVQGRTVELQARSNEEERLATGQKVTIAEILSEDTVLVASVSSATAS